MVALNVNVAWGQFNFKQRFIVGKDRVTLTKLGLALFQYDCRNFILTSSCISTSVMAASTSYTLTVILIYQ